MGSPRAAGAVGLWCFADQRGSPGWSPGYQTVAVLCMFFLVVEQQCISEPDYLYHHINLSAQCVQCRLAKLTKINITTGFVCLLLLLFFNKTGECPGVIKI